MKALLASCLLMLTATLVSADCTDPGWTGPPCLFPLAPQSPPIPPPPPVPPSYVMFFDYTNYTTEVYNPCSGGGYVNIDAVAGGGNGGACNTSYGIGGGGGGSGSYLHSYFFSSVPGELILDLVKIHAPSGGANGDIFLRFQNISDPYNNFRQYTLLSGLQGRSPGGGQGGSVQTRVGSGSWVTLNGTQVPPPFYGNGTCDSNNAQSVADSVSAWNGGSGGSSGNSIHYGYSAGYFDMASGNGEGGPEFSGGGGGGNICVTNSTSGVSKLIKSDSWGGIGRYTADSSPGYNGRNGGGGAGGSCNNGGMPPGNGALAYLMLQFFCS